MLIANASFNKYATLFIKIIIMLEVSDSEALGIDEVLKDLENCTQRWNDRTKIYIYIYILLKYPNDSIQTNQKNQTWDT